jgi:signal transduction histidine kinase
VVKHSGTKKAKVSLAFVSEKIEVVVEDKGEGISRKEGQDGFGLFSIRERIQHFGGSFSIYSEPGTGTKVAFSIPVSAGDNGAEKIVDYILEFSDFKA